MTTEFNHGEAGRRPDRERARLALSRIQREVTCLSRDFGELELGDLLARLASARRGLVDTGTLLLRDEFVMAVCHGDPEQRDPLRILEDLDRLAGPSGGERLSEGSRLSRR